MLGMPVNISFRLGTRTVHATMVSFLVQSMKYWNRAIGLHTAQLLLHHCESRDLHFKAAFRHHLRLLRVLKVLQDAINALLQVVQTGDRLVYLGLLDDLEGGFTEFTPLSNGPLGCLLRNPGVGLRGGIGLRRRG